MIKRKIYWKQGFSLLAFMAIFGWPVAWFVIGIITDSFFKGWTFPMLMEVMWGVLLFGGLVFAWIWDEFTTDHSNDIF